MQVRDVMATQVTTAREDTPLIRVAELLVAHGVSGVPVVSAGGDVVGILTEADLLGTPVLQSGRPDGPIAFLTDTAKGREALWIEQAGWMRARDVMTVSVLTAHPDEPVGSAARRMIRHGMKLMPVIEDGKLAGIVSRHDLLRAFGDEDELLGQRLGRLLERYFYFPPDHQILIDVEGGKVLLEGIVHYERDARVIEGLVAGAEGVNEVDSRLRFLEPGYPEARTGDASRPVPASAGKLSISTLQPAAAGGDHVISSDKLLG